MNVITEIEEIYGKPIEKQSDNLQRWKSVYECKPVTYEIPTGGGNVIKKTKKSLRLGKLISKSWARLLIGQKTYMTLPDDNDNLVFEKILEKQKFWRRANEGVEKEMALGGTAGVISLSGLVVNETTGVIVSKDKAKVHFEMVNAENIYPLKWSYGELVECAFVSFGSNSGQVVLHTIDKDTGNYVIKTQNYVRESSNSDFKKDGKVQIFNTLSNIPWFKYLKPNEVNNEDINSPLGLSVFANAMDEIEAADNIFDGYDNEYILGRKRVFVSADLTTIDINGKQVPTFDKNDMAVYVLPENDNGEKKITFSDGNLRAEAYSKGLNDTLALVSYKVGLGKGYFSFSSEMGRPIQTATAVISMQSELYRNIQTQEIFVEEFLRSIAQSLVYVYSTFTTTKFKKVYDLDEITVFFDDSLFEDKESQKTAAQKDVENGTMSRLEYRMKFTGEDEEAAREKLLSNPDYIAQVFSQFIPLIQSGLITEEMFVDIAFGKNYSKKNELVTYIKEHKAKGLEGDILDQIINGQMNNA